MYYSLEVKHCESNLYFKIIAYVENSSFLQSMEININFSGFIEPDRVKDYKEHRQKYSKKGRGAAFLEAITKTDEYISDPKVITNSCFTNVNSISIKFMLFHCRDFLLTHM